MTILRKILQFPYTIMRKFADSHNNIHDFTLLHASSWFIGLILTFGVSYLAWSADWDVLYGMDFNSSHDANGAWWKATILACIIQILVLVNGGMAVKIYINNLLKGASDATAIAREHLIQFAIHTLLFLAGMGATLYLSFKTDQSAKANAFEYAQALDQHLDQETKTLENTQATALARLDSTHQAQQKALDALHQQAIANASASERGELKEKQNKLSKIPSLAAKQELLASIDRSKTRITDAEAAPRATKAKALLALDSIQKIERKALLDKGETKAQYQADQAKSLLQSLQADIHTNAEATKYRNVALNIVGFILAMGLLFFARGANKPTSNQTPTPADKTIDPKKGKDKQVLDLDQDPQEATAEALEAQIRDAILDNDDLLAYELNQKLLKLQQQTEQNAPLSEAAKIFSNVPDEVLDVFSKKEEAQKELLATDKKDASDTLEWTLKAEQKPQEEGTVVAETTVLEAEYPQEGQGEILEIAWENGKPYASYRKKNGEVVKYDKSRISAQKSMAKQQLENASTAETKAYYTKRWQEWTQLHLDLNQAELQAKEQAKLTLKSA